jgi:predicted TIM-barrel fold metal-dependent hydrolase
LIEETDMTMQAEDHYTIISADCHAGGSHKAYREYLDPQYRDQFDDWRGEYRNPYKDLGDNRRLRNWDNEMRNSQQESDGIVGEVVFPNTVPPFFPNFVLFAKPPRPEDYELRRAGVHAHNRWLLDWCNEFPDRRAGVGQIFLNDLDHAMEDALWIKENGLRGGVMLPIIPPGADWVKPLYDPIYDPLWALLEDLEMPVNVHGGSGNPEYGDYDVSMLLYIQEVMFYSQRPLVQFILSGVFERFPKMRFVMTETGCSWVPPLLHQLDTTLERIASTGATGEIRYGDEHVLKKSATEYFAQNCWMGVSQPRRADAEAREQIGLDRFMWGSDYPHDEGTHPYTREHLRNRFHDVEPDTLAKLLGGNAAKLYDFDMAALAPLAEKFCPTVGEIADPIDSVPDDFVEEMSKDMDSKAI